MNARAALLLVLFTLSVTSAARASDAEPVGLGRGRCTITGTVRLAGRPVVAWINLRRAGPARPPRSPADEEAQINLLPTGSDSDPVQAAASERDGRFRFIELAPGLYVAHAFTEDRATGTTLVSLPLDGVVEDIALELRQPAPVTRIRVERADGSPYVGPIVAAPRPARHVGIPWWADRNGDAVARGVKRTTDARGGAELPGLPPGLVDVYLRDQWLFVRQTIVLPADGPLRIECPGPLALTRTSVVARSGRVPIAGAWSVWSVRGGDAIAAGWTGEIGGSMLVPQAGGRRRAFAMGFTSAPREHDGLWSTPEPVSGPTIALDRTATLRGTVRRANDGAPLAGMVVEATIETDPWGEAPLSRTVTDAEGRYTLTDLPAGDLAVRVHGHAGVAKGLRELDPNPSWRRDDPRDADPFAVDVLPGGRGVVDVDVVPGARVTGRLTDARGAPAVGVVVRASGPERCAMSSEPVDPPFWEVAYAVTDTDGRYAFESLLPEYEYDVTARRQDGVAVAHVKTPAGGSEQRVDLAFAVPVTVDVRVVDAASGAPAVGVPLTVFAEHYHSVERWSGLSGEDGLVRVGPLAPALPEEKLVVRTARGPWTLDDGGFPSPSADGKPARVLMHRDGPSHGDARDALSRALSGDGDDDSEDGPSRPLRVHVVDLEGRPVAQARLFFKRKSRGFTVMSHRAVELGEAIVLRHGGLGPTPLFVGDARDDDGRPLPLGWAVAGPVADDVPEVTIRLPADRAVRGRVVDPAGRGVRGLLVRALPAEKWPQEVMKRFTYDARRFVIARSRTDADGAFQIHGLVDERVELSVGTPVEYCDVKPLVVDTSAPGPIEVRLRAVIDVTVTVFAADGKPAVGGHVWVTEGAPATADIGADGKAVLRRVDPEQRYTLRAEGPGEREQFSRELWKPADTEIRLEVKR